MGFTDQAQAQWEVVAHSRHRVIQRSDIPRNFDHVIDRSSRSIRALEFEQLRQRGLRSLDFAREHGLLADIHVEEPMGIEAAGKPVESPDRQTRLLE